MEKFQFHRDLYSKSALIKAAYNFTDRAYIHLDADETYYYVQIAAKRMWIWFHLQNFKMKCLLKVCGMRFIFRLKHPGAASSQNSSKQHGRYCGSWDKQYWWGAHCFFWGFDFERLVFWKWLSFLLIKCIFAFIYSKAISDYQALAKITADEQAGEKIRILINSTKLPEELVRNEFENYLIALENRQC